MMQGKELGCDIPNRQKQYDANNQRTAVRWNKDETKS